MLQGGGPHISRQPVLGSPHRTRAFERQARSRHAPPCALDKATITCLYKSHVRSTAVPSGWGTQRQALPALTQFNEAQNASWALLRPANCSCSHTVEVSPPCPVFTESCTDPLPSPSSLSVPLERRPKHAHPAPGGKGPYSSRREYTTFPSLSRPRTG